MPRVRQRRIDNQPSATLSAPEAAALLGVHLRTLYAYVSRGLVRSVPSERGRARNYLRDDLERLKARHDARAGHAAVAAAALRWGEPVLDSALTQIAETGPRYRGRSSIGLALADTPFESVAELLWSGKLPAHRPVWKNLGNVELSSYLKTVQRFKNPMSALMFGVGTLAALKEPREHRTSGTELVVARDLLARLPEFCALARPNAVRARVARAPSIAEGLLLALGERAKVEHLKALESALVLCADHELNASAFTARVAASAGAELEACLCAALAALSGNQHGGMCTHIERLVSKFRDARAARRYVAECLRNRQTIPGFGHPLYPNGDPRSVPLLEQARCLNAREPRLRVLLAIVAGMSEHAAPTLDTALVALAFAMNLRPNAATAIFAVGRSAGLLAHAFEQREANFLLRPRARYVASAEE